MDEDRKIGAAYLDEAFRSLRGHKRLAEGALAQIDDAQFFRILDPEANSVAILVKHMAGNMRSRFTDLLSSDGEKPGRNRDQEFVIAPEDSRAELMRSWEESWQLALDTVRSLKPEDLLKMVSTRGQPNSVLQAVHRATAHYAHHVGQILFLAKHLKSAEWKSLSIPRGQSNAPLKPAGEKTRT
jgi:Protein of unknown function (DUF1572)